MECFSFINQQNFMWLAEYLDGTLLTEYDKYTKSKINIHAINKTELMKFGLIGCGYKFNFNTYDGTFNLLDKKIDVLYRTKNKVYNLTKQLIQYNDIIQFKEAISDINMFDMKRENEEFVTTYSFGYKVKMSMDGVNFNFKAICKIPMEANKPVYMEFWLVASEDLDGELVVLRNDSEVTSIKAPLKKNVGGFCNWIVI